MRPDGLEKRLLVETVEQKELRGAHAEAFQCGDQALLAGRASSRHDGDADGGLEVRVCGAPVVVIEALKGRQLLEEPAQGPRRMGRGGLFLLESMKAREPLLLVLALAFVVGDHAVEVEGDAQRRTGVVILVPDGRRHHEARRLACGDGIADILGVGAQKERGVEGGQIRIGRVARRKAARRNGQPVVAARMEEALGRLRRVARERNDPEGRQIAVELVEGEQAAHEGKGHARTQGRVLVADLMVPECLVALFLEKRVLLLKIEQRP